MNDKFIAKHGVNESLIKCCYTIVEHTLDRFFCNIWIRIVDGRAWGPNYDHWYYIYDSNWF